MMNKAMKISKAIDARPKESEVRSYSRSFPTEYHRANGSWLYGEAGEKHLDFLAGCGSLNYGHNHPVLKKALSEYIAGDGLTMALDMNCGARSEFIDVFHRIILKPRGLDHRIQFTGPTGANSVEAAIKLARKVTNRTNVISFTNGFHGCSLGALSLTGSSHHRVSSASLLNQVTRLPYDGYFGADTDTASQIEQLLGDPSSGIDAPAAFVVEMVQGEGGLQVASAAWIQKLAEIARHHGALLIVDDIQAGCGRTGTFFSFETMGIVPDMICMAKAVSGYGLPMSLLLLRPELDQWQPGEHNGTFRGNVCAFVTATAALEEFWAKPAFAKRLAVLCETIDAQLRKWALQYDVRIKGRGAMIGLEFADPDGAARIQAACIDQGLIIERCGPRDEVLKFLPPLTISDDELNTAFEIISRTLCRSKLPAN